MSLLSIVVILLGLTLSIKLIPIRLSVASFYLSGAVLYYPIYWLIAYILVRDIVHVNNPFIFSVLLLAHIIMFAITTVFFWNSFGLERRFLYAKKQVESGALDWILFPMAVFVFGTTVYRASAYGFLVAGVVPIDGIETFFELPYWDTILLSFQGFVFPLVIIWPMLRLSYIRDNQLPKRGSYKFRLLFLLAFLLSLSFGRSATIAFLMFTFLFGKNFGSIRLINLIKKSLMGLLIIIVAAPSFVVLRLALNDEFSNRSGIEKRILSNIGERAFDIIAFSDDILDSHSVDTSGPYLLNAYKRLTPSFLLDDCTSYNCPAKLTLEKSVLKALNRRDTDMPETFFIASLVDKSMMTFLFYPLALGFLIAVELLLIAKITSRNSIYFLMAYSHIGYSLLKIEADASWFLFHVRDAVLLFTVIYFFTSGLNIIRRLRFVTNQIPGTLHK